MKLYLTILMALIIAGVSLANAGEKIIEKNQVSQQKMLSDFESKTEVNF